MSLAGGNFGIVVEKHLGRISIFNTATLSIIRQLTLGFDFNDVAITRDCNRAVVTSDNSRTLVELNTQVSPPAVDAIQVGQFTMGDVDTTPDGRFAVSEGGTMAPVAFQSYSLRENRFVSTLPAPGDATGSAISPTGNGLVLSAGFNTNTVRVLMISPNGTLIDTGRDIPTGGAGPLNVTFTPDGNFAFVANFFGNSVRHPQPEQHKILENRGHQS